MQDILTFLGENPFVVVFVIFVLSLITFFAFEIFAEHKRLEKHYHIKRIISGTFLIALALFVLFAPYAGIVAKSLYPSVREKESISTAFDLCNGKVINEEYKEGCSIITGINYICYLLLFIGIALIIAGIVSIK